MNIPAPRAGDIGTEKKRIELEPLENPETAPVEPAVQPVQEPVPA
jgi:hypothetical protein